MCFPYRAVIQMPHESTVAHEHEQRLSKEDTNTTTKSAITLEPLGEVLQNNIEEVSTLSSFFLITFSPNTTMI